MILTNDRLNRAGCPESPLFLLAVYMLILFTVLVFPVCSREFEITSGELGSSLTAEGRIGDSILTYRFKGFPGGKKKDIFNYIYFKGDTVCFSFELTRTVERDMVSVWFIDPKKGERFKAERIDICDNRVSGFSLLGSILENFYSKNLGDPIPTDALFCRNIPFAVEISIDEKGTHLRKKLISNILITVE